MTTRITRSSRCAAVAIAATLIGLSACGSDANTSSGSDSAASSKPTVVIVTHSAFVLDETVQRNVEKKLGVRIKLSQSGDGAEALSAAILTAGRPEGDIFFGADNTLLTRATNADLFEKLAPEDIPNLESVPASLDLDASRQMVPIDVAPVCVDYDTSWFAERDIAPPTSLDDLVDPRYKDLMVVQNPATSSTGLVFLMGTHVSLGEGAADWWRKLVANGVSVAGGWTDAWEVQYTVSGGDRPIVVSYATSPPAEVVYSDGKVTTPKTAVIDSTCTEQVEFGGVLKGANQPAAARRVLNEMLGTEWQASQPLSNFVYPARSDVTLPDVFEQFAVRPTDTIVLDPKTVAERRDEWIDEWRSIAE